MLFDWHEDDKYAVPGFHPKAITMIFLSACRLHCWSCLLSEYWTCDVMDDWKPFGDGILPEEITTSDYDVLRTDVFVRLLRREQLNGGKLSVVAVSQLR